MKKTGFIVLLLIIMFPHKVLAAYPPWQTFAKDGRASEDIYISGRAKKPADLVVNITKSGSDREGEYRYSTDGGKAWSDDMVIKAGTDIPIRATSKDAADLGIKIRFAASCAFKKGDIYRLYEPVEYEVSESANAGSGRIQVSSDDVIYSDSYSIAIKITKSGGLGEGQFSYSLNGGKTFSEPMAIPQSGAVRLFNNLITIRFWDGAGRFLVGDEFRCAIKGDQSKRNYMPYIVGTAAACVIILMMMSHRLSMMRDDAKSYRIREYRQVASSKKRGLPKRRKM